MRASEMATDPDARRMLEHAESLDRLRDTMTRYEEAVAAGRLERNPAVEAQFRQVVGAEAGTGTLLSVPGDTEVGMAHAEFMRARSAYLEAAHRHGYDR